MRVAILNNQALFVRGGAEELADHLARRVRGAGHEVEIVRIPFRWEPYTVLPKQIEIARHLNLDRADKVIALKFPTYLVPHENKTLWLLHQYRQAYDLYEVGNTNLPKNADGDRVRQFIVDNDELAFAQSRSIYVNSPVTQRRLRDFNQVESTVLYPPLNDPEIFTGGEAQPYVFAGGRINDCKRQELLVRALARTTSAVRLVVAGPPDSARDRDKITALAERLGVGDRLTLDLRFVEREAIASWVNGAAACAYLPYDEDSLGYVTMEAAQASKPVLTTTDSGGVLGLVKDGVTGWVVEPDVDQLAAAMENAVVDSARSRDLGVQMQAQWKAYDTTWPTTVEALLR